MELDVYYCTLCGEEFAVKADKKPDRCPFCGEEISFGHTVKQNSSRKPNRKTNNYAIYKGDELLVTGTAKECASLLNVSQSYIYWLVSPTAQKRLEARDNPEKCVVGVRLDDE